MNNLTNEEIKSQIEKNFSKIAHNNAGCCAPDCCDLKFHNSLDVTEVSKSMGYSKEELDAVPMQSNLALGCGNPQGIANLKKGETVLDLGCGAGFDAFLASQAVGSGGFVIGVDMTWEMITKSRQNLKDSKYNNIEFRLGEIEHLPVADSSLDVILSNCVINLSTEKQKVFEESFRVLKDGGRLAIADVVATMVLPDNLKEDLALLTGCISGAVSMQEIEEYLSNAGFEDIKIKPIEKGKDLIGAWVPGKNINDYILSATIEAVKP